jgi:isocitrate lyase
MHPVLLLLLCFTPPSLLPAGGRTSEGFFEIRGGIESAIARGLAYAPYADLVWFETGEPSLEEATAFAKAIHEKYPGKLLAYNCSPSFNWKKKLDDDTIASFQQTLGGLGYKFQVGWGLVVVLNSKVLRTGGR